MLSFTSRYHLILTQLFVKISEMKKLMWYLWLEDPSSKSDGHTHKSNHHLVNRNASFSSSTSQNTNKILVCSKGIHCGC